MREHGPMTDSIYGSRHLVQKLSSAGELGRIQAMILVDMIGDSNLVIHREAGSTPWLTDKVFNAAHRLGYAKYFPDAMTAVDDDHVPFVNAGVAAVDLIDFEPRRRLLAYGQRYGGPLQPAEFNDCGPRGSCHSRRS